MCSRDFGAKRKVASILSVALMLSQMSFCGSVFMKNGYILQGPITEKTQERVVLEWPNGRVIIPRRFIKAVVLEPKEKKSLELARESKKKAKQKVSEEELLEVNVYLPPNPEELLPGFRKEKKPEEPGSRAILPTVELGERREIVPGLSGSLPQGWNLSKVDETTWVIEGASEKADLPPLRLSGTVVSSSLGKDSEISLAKQRAEKFFRNWVIISEGWRELGMKRAYQFQGRGEVGGVAWNVLNILAWTGKKVWLLSCVWPKTNQDLRKALEWFLQSLEFES